MTRSNKLFNLLSLLLITFVLLLSIARAVGNRVDSINLSNNIYQAFVSSYIE